MNRLAQKYMSVICVGAIFMTTISTAGAVANINPSDEIYYVTEEAVASTDYISGRKYDLIIPHVMDDTEQNPYGWLSNLLKNQKTIWENSDENGWIYDLSISDRLNLPDCDTIVEISYIDGTYSISYHTKSEENVILHYYPDGTIDRYVRDTNTSDILLYDGATEKVSQYSEKEGAESRASSKKSYDFPTPKELGHKDTGPNGKVTGTKSVYISQLQKNLTARVVEYESDYKKKNSGWKSWIATTTIGAVATFYGWGEYAAANFLSGLGVGIAITQGVKKLKDDISLPKYPDYIATEGKYGDIFDTTVYNKYCRVYYNVGQSVYAGGVLPNGIFNYAKKGYTGIKSDSEVYNKVQNLFNTCIASYGSNTMYDPV